MRTSLSWYSPDPPLRVETSGAAIRPCEVEVDAVAAVLVLDGEDELADVLLVAPHLVRPIDALEGVVADEALLHEDQLIFVFSVSCQAVHVLLPSGVSTLALLLAGQLDQMALIVALPTAPPALSGPCSRTAVPAVPITLFSLPEGLVGADDLIRREIAGCRVQFVAVDGESFLAPGEKGKAVVAKR